MKQWHFFDKVYRVWVVLVISSPEDFLEFMKDSEYTDLEFIEELTSMAQGAMLRVLPEHNTLGNNSTIIWMPKWDSGTLVHEISHLVMQIFDDSLIPISKDNTEAFAFYSEFWWNSFNRTYKKFPNGNKPKDARL